MRITNIKQLLPFVEKKPEFVVIDKGEYVVIDYVYQDANTFDQPELMECRGIKFDKNGLILARPFRTFFNYGERGAQLPAHRRHIITEKLDGSMIHPVKLNRRSFLMTRKGHTDVAKQAEQFVLSEEEVNYISFCSDMMRQGWTPIFEYIGPDNRIVLRYDDSNMVLLALRHTIEGTIMPYLEMLAAAELYGVPVVQPPTLHEMTLTNVDSFVNHTRALADAEGYVVYFDDGYMVKVKADDYVMKHRAIDDLNSKKKVVAICAQGFLDDVLPILDERDREDLQIFNKGLQLELIRWSGTAGALAQRVLRGDMTRKEFALNVAPTVEPKFFVAMAFGVMDGKDSRRLAIDAAQKHTEYIQTRWRGQ